MSSLVELNGKAGRVCHLAQAGQLRCPCIVRSTSEDVLTGEVIGHLRHIRPHLWLGPLLNLGLGTNRFRQVWYKDLSIRLWERQERFPPELIPFKEGRSEPDIIIEWENPPTTVWIEAKYTSPLSEGTSNSTNNDQALRGIRTLLVATGHIQPDRLFQRPKREAVWLALLSYKPEPIVDRYRDDSILMDEMPGAENLVSVPKGPFVGTVAWTDISDVLKGFTSIMTPTEASIASDLTHYLSYKLTRRDGGETRTT